MRPIKEFLRNLEGARIILAVPGPTNVEEQLKQLRDLLDVQVGLMPDEITPRAMWEARRNLDLYQVALDVARETFLVDPAIQSLTFDFIDCDGVPCIWLGYGDDEDQVIHGDYSGGKELPECMEALAADLLAEYHADGEVRFDREEVFPSAEPEADPSEAVKP